MSHGSHGAWDDEEDGVKRPKGYNAEFSSFARPQSAAWRDFP
jgi:hypothetical protein